MSPGARHTPLIRRTLLKRIAKGIAVASSAIFLIALGLAYWGLETGRAAELVRQDILTELRERCGIEARFSAIELDPLRRELRLSDLEMVEQEGGAQLIAVEKALVALRFLPLFYGRYHLERVALLRPEATIRLEDGRVLNLPRCIESDGEAPLSPVALGINELTVERGRFDLEVDGWLTAKLGNIGVSLSPGEAGGMDVAVGVDDGLISTATKSFELRRLRMLGHLEGLLVRPRALNLDDVQIELGQTEARLSGAVDLLGPVYEAKVKAKLPLAAVHDFVDDLPRAQGQAELDLSVSGTAVTPRAVGQVVLTGARVGEFAFGDRAELELAADLRGLTFTRIDVDVGAGHVSGRGALRFEDGLPFEVDLATRRLSLARVLDAVTVPGSWADLLATGEADLAGTLEPVALEGDFAFDVDDFVVFDRAWDAPAVAGRGWRDVPAELRMLAIPSVRTQGRWRFTDRALTFSDAQITTGATAGTCNARIGFGIEEGLEIDAQLPSFDWIDVGPVAGLRFGGFGSVSGRVFGPMDDIAGVGIFELEDITIASVPFGAGHGSVDWHDGVFLDITGIEGRLGDSRFDARVGVELRGEVPLSISGHIRSGRVEDVLVPFRLDGRDWGDPQGELTARFDLVGPIDRLTGPIDVTLGAVSIVGEKAERGRVVGRMEQGRIVAESLELKKHDARIQAYGFVDPNRGDLRLRARTFDAHLQDLDVLQENLPRFDGALDVKLALDGSIHGVTGTVSAQFVDVRAGTVPIGSGKIAGPVKGMQALLSGQVGSISLERSTVGIRGGLPYAAKIRLAETNVPRIVAGLSGDGDYTGSVSLVADLRGSLVNWARSSGEIQIEQARLQAAGLFLESAALAKLSLDRGVLRTKRLMVSGPRTRLVAEGALGGQAIDLRVSGRVDLGLFELTSPSIEKAGGQLTLDAALAGTPSDVEVVGTGHVEGGLFQLRGFDNRATNFSGDLTFSQSSVLIDRATGRWAGGKIGISGSLQLERFLPKALALRIELDKARPRFAYDFGDLEGQISGVINWAGPWARSQMSGVLEVRRGVVRPKLDWQSLVQPRSVAPVYDPSAEVMDFDLQFTSEEPIRVKNDEADVEVTGEVRLTGTNQRIGMLGSANVLRGGRVIFLGREYTMESGVVEFRDRYRFTTRYDLVLSARACDARISLNVLGSFEEVETIYSSYPEMDQRDIVSCLIRGVKVSELDQDLASFAGSALLKLSGVDREVKKVLPIDQIDVTTEYSSLSRQYEPRVVIGKDLEFLDRPMRLVYSTSLLRSDDQRAAVRMRLTPRLNLQLGWTSSEDVPFGDWGVDLRQRWEW